MPKRRQYPALAEPLLALTAPAALAVLTDPSLEQRRRAPAPRQAPLAEPPYPLPVPEWFDRQVEVVRRAVRRQAPLAEPPPALEVSAELFRQITDLIRRPPRRDQGIAELPPPAVEIPPEVFAPVSQPQRTRPRLTALFDSGLFPPLPPLRRLRRVFEHLRLRGFRRVRRRL